MGVITLLVAIGGFYMYRKQSKTGTSDNIPIEPGVPSPDLGITPDSGITPSPETPAPDTKPKGIISDLINQVPGILGALPGLISGITGIAGGGGG